MEAPTIIKMELEIDREMALDNGEELSSDEEHIYEPEQEQQQQKVAADFKSLDEMVSFKGASRNPRNIIFGLPVKRIGSL